MKKLLLLIIVLAAVGVGGKFYLEYKYETELDKAIAFAGAFANISYDKVEIGLDSSISVKGIRIKPAQLDDSISIQTVVLNSSDPLFPIKGPEIFKDNNFPERFSIGVKRLSFDASIIDDANTEPECRSLFSSIKYSISGYDRVDADMRFSMDFSDVYNSKISVSSYDQISTSLFEIVLDASQVSNVALGREPAPVDEFSAAIEINQSAAQSIVEYCADVFNVSPDSFLDKVVASPKFSENSFHYDLGPDMRQALVALMRGDSRLMMVSRPDEKLKNLAQAQFFKPNEVLSWLNMSVSIDGVKVSIKIPEPKPEEDQVAAKDAEAQKNKQKYVAVSALRARDYIGSKVRIKRRGDKKSIKGRMTGFEKNRIAVEVYRYAGEMTLNVPVDDVAKFEVFQ